MVSASSVWGADEVLSGCLWLTRAQLIQGLQCLGSTRVANPSPGPRADVNNMYRECRLQLPHLGQLQPETASLQGEHTVPPPMICLCCVYLSLLISPLPSQTYKPSHSATASELWDWWDAVEESTWKNCLKTVHFIDCPFYNWSYIGGSASCNPWKCYMDSMQKCRAKTSRKGKKNICKECHVLSGVCLTVMATLACSASALNNGTASFA